MRDGLAPQLWGLERRDGRLYVDGCDLCALADRYGTPLYVVSTRVLAERVHDLLSALADYPTEVRICFSYKTNRVAGVLQQLHAAGCGAEVVDGFELQLARALRVPPGDIVFNGPNKTEEELELALRLGVGLVVVDGFAELERVARLAEAAGIRASILLRICPDVRPRGMNVSSMTGSRRTQFGFDARSGEVQQAIRQALAFPSLRLRGVMAHVGSGIRDLGSVAKAVDRLLDSQEEVAAAGGEPDVLDVGGGLGARFSREFTTPELLRYLAFGRLPRRARPAPEHFVERYGTTLIESIVAGTARRRLPVPALVLEPGRALVSDAQVLLLRVGAVRERPGVTRFALTDGGAMTVSMMFLSELHAVLLANRDAPIDGVTTVTGRLPSPMDVVYRGVPLPSVVPDDLLAVMDAGAYFTATETTFGGPRPAVVMLEDGDSRLIRRRETFSDRIALEVSLDGDGSA